MITKPEIYTKKFVAKELEEMLAKVKENKNIIFIGQVFEDKPYTRERFSEWRKKFQKDSKIPQTIKKIKEILESRTVSEGMQGRLNPTMVIFNLKNNYGWKDAKQHDHTTKGEAIKGFNYIVPNDADDKADN
jgi:hypothetical protein